MEEFWFFWRRKVKWEKKKGVFTNDISGNCSL